MKKLLFIVNPTAGKKRVVSSLSDILRIFCAHGYAPTVLMTERSGHAVELCRDNIEGNELVVCAGGDGTLNETINGLLVSGADVPVAYLPCGTTNDLANTLGLSTNLLSAAKDAVEGDDKFLDIGSFNGRNFVYTASFGAFTKASYGTPQSVKNALGHMAYVLEGVQQLGSLKPTHVKVTTEKEELEGDYLFGSVSNTTSLGGIITIDKELVMLDDGEFELMLVDMPHNVLDFSKLLNQITTAKFGDMIHLSSAASINMEMGENTDWTLDGELEKGETLFDIKNLHNAIRIRVPKKPTESE